MSQAGAAAASVNAGGAVEALPAVVDAAVAAALWRKWQPRLAQIGAFDLAAVTELDSAGVALLRAMRAAQLSMRGATPAALRNVPERYRALCVAHRVPVDG